MSNFLDLNKYAAAFAPRYTAMAFFFEFELQFLLFAAGNSHLQQSPQLQVSASMVRSLVWNFSFMNLI